MIDYSENKEVIDRITEINDQINEEDSKEVADNGKLTKLMFEQMCGWIASQKGLKPTFLRYFNAAGALPEW